MRIALIDRLLMPPGRGGAETCVVALAEYLRHRHQVIVFSGSPIELEGVRCVQLPALDPLPADAHSVRKAWLHLRDQWLPKVHRALRRGLAEARVELVNTHVVQGLSAAVFTAVASLNLPHVHTTHDPNVLCARALMSRGGEFCGGRCLTCRPQRIIRGHALAARLDALISPSRSLLNMHVAAGLVDAERAFLIRQGVQPGKATLRIPDPNAVRLGFIGRLDAAKGPLTLLRAMRELPSGWRLSIAGGGPLEDTVRAASLGDPRIDFMGGVQGAAKQRFFEGIDVLVIPSEWEEPAPLVGTEAAIRGVPAVVSDRGGLPEIPLSRSFRAGDSAALAGTLKEFVPHLASASRELLARRDEFLFTRYGRETEEVLLSAAHRSDPGHEGWVVR